MKLKNKILSAILVLTVVASSILPVTMVANAAGRSSPGGGGSSAYSPGTFTYTCLNSDIVMRIGISSITDESDGGDMKSEVGRYGNGIRARMHEYPLFIRSEHYDAGEGAGGYEGVPYKEYSDNIDKICSDIESLRAKINSGRGWRTDRYKEFWNENIITYTANTNISAEGKASVYLEDAVLKVKDLYDNGKISDVELRDFWYFYTSMAAVAINSKDGTTAGNPSFTTGMSDKLNELFTGYEGAGKSKTYDYAILDNEDRKAMMQSGFLIALYAVYGDTPFKEVTGNNFVKSDSHHLFSNDYTSFVFDRCWTDNLQNYVEPYLLVSTHTWAELRAYHDSMSYNTYEERSFYPAKGIGWDVIPNLAPNMCPAYTNNVYAADGKTIIHKRFDPRCPNDCAGWSYYEIATGGDAMIKVGYPNAENAQLEVTYNAFLTSGDSDSDYTTESDTFGDNGHVMTDTVYLSSVMSKDEVIKSINPLYSEFKDNKGYFNTIVENQIYLSSPFEKTQYNLKKLQYRIVDAGGSLNDATYGSDSVDVSKTNIISVSGSKFKSAFNNENAKYYVIQKKTLLDNGVIAGQYRDDKGVLQDYKVYLSSADGNSIMENVSKNLKDAAAGGYLNKTWDSIRNCIATKYPPSTYCLKIEDEYYPIIKENNIYYLCPRQFVNNLLVQVRADYTATYSKEAVLNNSNGTKQSAVYDEYLLTKNFSTEDMISNTKNKLYSMIDDYSTSAWGDTYNRYNKYYDSTNTEVDIKDNYKAKNGTFVYDVGSLFGASYLLGGETQFKYTPERAEYRQYFVDANGHQQSVIKSGTSFEMELVKSKHSIYNSELLTNSKVKTQFRTRIEKTAPLLSLSTDDGKTYLNSSLPVLIKSYDNSMNINSSINQSGLYYTSADYDVEDRVSKCDSYVASNPKAYPFTTVPTSAIAMRSGVRGYADTIDFWGAYYGDDVVGEYDEYTTNRYYQAGSEAQKVPMYGAETSVGNSSKFSGSVDLTKDSDNGFQHIRNSVNEKKYLQVDFEKLLTYYNKYLYQKRGNINASLTPSIASWMYSNTTVNTHATDYAMSYGIKNSNTYVGYKADKAEYNKDDGFIRFGTSKRVGGGNRILLNSQGVPTAVQRIDLDAHVDNSEFKGGVLDVFDTTGAIAPQTQSSYDIPIRYTIKSHTTANKNKQALETAYNKLGSKISMFYQYSADDITTGISKYQGSNASSWKYNKVSIAVYPEVRMWAEKDFTGNPTKHKPESNLDYNTVATVGTQLRYIPATTYTTLDFGGLNVNAQVVGTAVAYDTRAKKLATELGTVDTQVLYSGTAINGTISSKASGTITTYALDFRNNGALNGQDIKTAWGNSNYTSSNAASKAMSLMLDQFKVSSSANMSIYNGSTLTNVPMDIASTSDADLTAGSIKEGTTRYNVYLRGSQIYEVIVYTKVGTGYAEVIRYRFIDPDGSNERDGYTKLLEILENGTSIPFWYNTKSCKIAVVNGRYVYNGTTELTATERNNYLAIYNGTADVTIETFKDLRTLLTNMRLYGNDSVLKNVFEYNTGVDLPNGLVNSTGGTKSYNEDCSVLQIRGYTATISSADSKSTFSEQIPINAGPATPVDKNMYFSKGYKGFINASVEVIAKNDIKDITGSIIIAKDTVFASDIIKHKVKGSVDEVVVDDVSKAKTAIPDFIIGDVPISEALNG